MPYSAKPSVQAQGHRDRAQRGFASASHSANVRLVLVTCSDMGRLDAMLRPAIIRLDTARHAALLEPIGTAKLPAGSGARLRPSAFDAAVTAGDLVLSWQEGGRRHGYDAALIRSLQAGITAIAPARAGCNLEAEARALFRHVTVIHVEPGTDTLRSRLSPSSCDIRLRDVGDLASAVRALSEALRPLIPHHVLAPLDWERAASTTPELPHRPHARPRRPGRASARSGQLQTAKPRVSSQTRAASLT